VGCGVEQTKKNWSQSYGLPHHSDLPVDMAGAYARVFKNQGSMPADVVVRVLKHLSLWISATFRLVFPLAAALPGR
jgi:hypothetical protein